MGVAGKAKKRVARKSCFRVKYAIWEAILSPSDIASFILFHLACLILAQCCSRGVVLAALALRWSPVGEKAYKQGHRQHARQGSQCMSATSKGKLAIIAIDTGFTDPNVSQQVTFSVIHSSIHGLFHVSYHLYMTGLIFRPLFVFLINVHSTEITVTCIFLFIYLFFRKATPTPTHRNKHPSHSCKYTERLQDQDAVRCFTFCVGGESDSKSSLVCFPIKKKSAWRKQCCGVLRPAVQQCYISQAVRKDASCFCNASNFVKMLSMEK